MRLKYVIVFVSDMKRAVAFYRDTLELPLKFESPAWTEFATLGATLALHVTEAANVEKDTSEDLPAGRCRPGLSVPHLDAFHARMVAKKVPCVQPPTTVFGSRIAQYLDPDGMAISISEDDGGS